MNAGDYINGSYSQGAWSISMLINGRSAFYSGSSLIAIVREIERSLTDNSMGIETARGQLMFIPPGEPDSYDLTGEPKYMTRGARVPDEVLDKDLTDEGIPF